jgi:catechol 2,3-dioxygenase-like lactoylglutathione lyase family enzyme
MASIIAPVSRHLDVTDVARTVAYYRDVLGFTVAKADADADGPAEVTSGPARITLGSPNPRASGERSILFFEVDDTSGMRSVLAARGAKPTAAEDVNWIKMRMFEVRDPDGNAIWFGRSFNQPGENVERRALRKVMPELPFTDVPAAVAYYRDVLGFSINYQQHDIGVMDRDGQRLLLIERTAHHTGIGSCSFYVFDADALHAELVASGAHVQGEPVSYPWGLREFKVLDLEDNRLSFAQTFE